MFLDITKDEHANKKVLTEVEHSVIETMKTTTDSDEVEVLSNNQSQYILEINNELYRVEIINNNKIVWNKFEGHVESMK